MLDSETVLCFMEEKGLHSDDWPFYYCVWCLDCITLEVVFDFTHIFDFIGQQKVEENIPDQCEAVKVIELQSFHVDKDLWK